MTVLSQGQQSSAIYILRNAEPYDAVFNDPSLPAYVGGLAGDDGISGLDSPEVRESADVLVEADGGLHGNFYFGRRPITLTTQVFDATIAARETKLTRLKRASNMMRSNGSLFWFPGDPSIVTTTRENLVRNPSFEYDTVGAAPAEWTDFSDAAWTAKTFAVSASNPQSGVNSLRWTATKDATATSRAVNIWSATTGNAGYPVVAGRAYSAQVKLNIVNALASGTGFQCNIVWYDANNGYISSTTGAALAVGASGVQTVSVANATAPAGAAYAQVQVYGTSTGVSDVVDVYLDAAQLVAETAVGNYLDGDSANSSWSGIRGQSTSFNRPNMRVLTTLRRQQATRFSGIGWSKGAFLSMVAADPRIYSAAIYDALVAPATNLTLENQGDTESPPVRIRVNGPGTDPTVKLTALGVVRNIVFSGLTLTGGQYIDIDVVNRTVKDQAGASQYGKLVFTTTTWWGLQPGPNNVARVDWGSGSTGASTLQVRYRDAWM